MQWLPMKPDPPVTRTVLMMGYPFALSRSCRSRKAESTLAVSCPN